MSRKPPFHRNRNRPHSELVGRNVVIEADCPWDGTVGVVEDAIPHTDWLNVRVPLDRPDHNGDTSLRLALYPWEFVLVGGR